MWLGSSVAVLCLAFAGFWYWINIPPQVEVPAPELPSPNGYDYFFRAGEAFVRDDKGVDEITDYYPPSGETKDYPIAAKEAWLEKNASALRLLKEGLKYEARRPPVRSLDTALPELSQFRDLARALAVESRVRAERGDWNGAIQSALDCYSFGNQIGRGGPQVPGAMSVAIRNIGLRELGDLLPHIDAATARETAANLEKEYEHRYPYYKTLEDEKWAWVAGILLYMKEPSWRTLMFQAYNNPVLLSENVSLPSKIDNMKWLVFSKRKLIDGLIKAMDMSINNARRPYREQSAIPIIKTKTGSPFGDMLRSIYKRQHWNWARCDTASALVMTMYALHAYQLERGRYPGSIQALVPEYLREIPTDPFDGIAPLRYQLEEEKYLLWSIGPDGVDNHGTPIVNPDREGRSRHQLLFPESEGDVVAGINLP